MDHGKYTSIRPIGAGGMGRVFAARDEPLGRDVAIKISHAPLSGSGLDARLRQEAQVLAQLEHPGIVPVHSIGQLGDGRIFYVMKLVQGATLEEAPERPLAESAALAIFERVVDAVAFAHTRGVVHRDLKPANIMIGSFGEVLVMDWGVAKILAQPALDGSGDEAPATAGGTEPGTRMGTPGFMSPEQAEGNLAAVSPASDVYALGALLSWLMTAQTHDRRQRLARRLRAIIAKCLAHSPADRYPDAAGVAADLARYRAGEAVDALPETIIDRIVRLAAKHLTLIVLVAAYLLMRVLVAWWR
ncbi:MAG TPA: serine/threonine-protein kinase [Vicinamibacterales bacterium]|nr:serine/threonine-protein kinase [Vicinamibacterales bacterium]